MAPGWWVGCQERGPWSSDVRGARRLSRSRCASAEYHASRRTRSTGAPLRGDAAKRIVWAVRLCGDSAAVPVPGCAHDARSSHAAQRQTGTGLSPLSHRSMSRRCSAGVVSIALASLAPVACGGDSDSGSTTAAPASGERAGARQACVSAANKMPDTTGRDEVLKRCENIGQAGAGKTTGARRACVDSANRIPATTAREAVVEQCNKLPE
jgi:hypothetical protein